MLKCVLFILIALTVSCASDKPDGKTEAEVLFKEAKSLMDDGSYILATEKINQLKNQYPYSYYSTPAELLQADILFLQENFVESAAAYLMFRDLHPKHKKRSFVIYRIAESYFMQVPDGHDRDLTSAHEAIKYYQELVKTYPESKRNVSSKANIKFLKAKIRGKEKYIADFYFKTDIYDAARWRYLDILENFKKKSLQEHAMIRVVESSIELEEYKKCISYADKFKNKLDSGSRKQLLSLKKTCLENK